MPSGGTRLSLGGVFSVRQMHISTIIPMQAYTCIICLRASSGWRVLVDYWLWWPRGGVSVQSAASSKQPYGYGHAVLKAMSTVDGALLCVRVKEGHGAMM